MDSTVTTGTAISAMNGSENATFDADLVVLSAKQVHPLPFAFLRRDELWNQCLILQRRKRAKKVIFAYTTVDDIAATRLTMNLPSKTVSASSNVLKTMS